MSKDNVLVIGNGGREHAIKSKLEESKHVRRVDMLAATEPENNIANYCDDHNVQLVVVGPEQPLVNGLADYLNGRNISVFGTNRDGAMLEGSKLYSKCFMRRAGIPTADFGCFQNYDVALGYALQNLPVYIKADGLAAGKGAMDGSTEELARDALKEIMIKRKFGPAGDFVVIEKKLSGEEVSYTGFINADSNIAVPLLLAQDHKKLLAGDKGPNTGGMGAYAPTRLANEGMKDRIYRGVLRKTMDGLNKERILFTNYCGPIYPGLMIDDNSFNVLEYNVRMGDPETQVILPMLKSDLYEAIFNVINGLEPDLQWHPGYAVCVVLASKGYPETPEKGKEIYGLDPEGDALNHDVAVFHAGTKHNDDRFYTNGGRVLNVVARGETIDEAIKRVYFSIGHENNGIWFEGMQYRKDIGQRELLRSA